MFPKTKNGKIRNMLIKFMYNMKLETRTKILYTRIGNQNGPSKLKSLAGASQLWPHVARDL